MSKSSKTCEYVFKRGPKEGDTCGAPSRGDFCKNHNAKKMEYSKKYYAKKNAIASKDNYKAKLRQLKKITINKLKYPSYQFRVLKIEQECKGYIKKILGVGMVADPEHYEPKLEEATRKNGGCKWKAMIEYKGTQKEAKKLLEKLISSKDTFIKKFKRAKEMFQIVDERFKKYHEENGHYPKSYFTTEQQYLDQFGDD